MINPRLTRLTALLNTPPSPLIAANASALGGCIERTLVLQEDLLAATKGSVHASLRPRFDSHVRKVNLALCEAWEAAQEMINRGVDPRLFQVSNEEPRRSPYLRGTASRDSRGAKATD